jgi:ribonuclease E/ribonuclease G
VAEPAARVRLAETPGLEPGGWIVRARAAEAPPEQIQTEGAALARAGGALFSRLPGLSAPALVAEGPGAVIRLLVESAELPHLIEIADGAARAQAEGWATDFGVGLAPTGSPDGDPFAPRDLHGRIEELLRPEVPLPGGGAIIIEPTRALVAVDVDAGANATPLQANLEAAREIARQIRLRHVGGIVVIDFVTMRREQDRKNLLSALRQAVSQDPVPTHLYGMSALGLVELVRERRGLALSQLLNTKTR